jgi:hypothetical protein
VLDDDDDDVDVDVGLAPQVQVYDTGSEDPGDESESGGLMVCSMGKRCCPGLRSQALRYTCTVLLTDQVGIVAIGLGNPFRRHCQDAMESSGNVARALAHLNQRASFHVDRMRSPGDENSLEVEQDIVRKERAQNIFTFIKKIRAGYEEKCVRLLVSL